MHLLDRITIDPNRCQGKPCIRGTEIVVSTILEKLTAGLEIEEILKNYPMLVQEDIQAIIKFHELTLTTYYAHSNESSDTKTWQLLITHLQNTAGLAKKFTTKFGMNEIGYVQGLLHDAGKYSKCFQQKLFGKNVAVDHSTSGAKIAYEQYKGVGKLIAYSICGHHGGLPDGIDAGFGGDRSSLSSRLKKKTEDISAFWNEINLPENVKFYYNPQEIKKGLGVSLGLLTRMLFSSLVDADFLDTEAYYSPEAAKRREILSNITLDDLIPIFFRNLHALQSGASDTKVNRYRNLVYQDCIQAANQAQGIFTLTVPTGGGKTLSSFAFALKHAQTHGLERIIFAIPFTSIIEQNADKLRKLLGEKGVLEHHSNFEFNEDNDYVRLAAENWDAPVVVTTNVQFFESLFSNKPSRCRKLHNISKSVIILDEAQAIPDHYLKPCLTALQSLCSSFGSTVVLCTATQPALDKQWPDTVEVTEIIQNPRKLYEAFRKVHIHNLGEIENAVLAEKLISFRQVLCIVNTRKHAKKIYELLPQDDDLFHLSALMCPAHRTQTLKIIRERLDENKPCRVISTQLIEAGVDVDFPVVFRAAAGIDSIAQAAGRCNREGLQKSGDTYVFYPEDGLPKGWFQRMAALGTEIMDSGLDPLSLTSVKKFFSQRYLDSGINGLDKYEIIRAFQEGCANLDFPFEQVAREFRFIEATGTQIVIPFDEKCRAKLPEAEESDNPWQLSRFFQKYTVTVYPYEYEQLLNRSLVKKIGESFIVLDVDDYSFKKVYDKFTGLNVDPDPEVLSV